MSATHRSDVRAADDFYRTPGWAVRAVLPEIELEKTETILEPCAGDGAIVRELIAAGVAPGRVVAIELDAERALLVPGACAGGVDFLTTPPGRVDLVIGNPPYRQAEPFVRRALEWAPEVWFLLRLGFLAGLRRSEWLRRRTPDVYVIPRRPSFTPDGRSDAADYAWFRFSNERGPGRVTILEVRGV